MLYKRMPTGVHLRCVDKEEAQAIIETMHVGVCRPHMNGTVLAKMITQQGYFWLTMESDCVKFVKKCHDCQAYRDVSHLPSMELQGLTSLWPFTAWEINIIGEIRLTTLNRHWYIMMAVDYFSKWDEAESYTSVGSK